MQDRLSGKTLRSIPHSKGSKKYTAKVTSTIDSRFITTALSGTRIDRKTIISSRNDRVRTAALELGRRAGLRCGELTQLIDNLWKEKDHADR